MEASTLRLEDDISRGSSSFCSLSPVTIVGKIISRQCHMTKKLQSLPMAMTLIFCFQNVLGWLNLNGLIKTINDKKHVRKWLHPTVHSRDNNRSLDNSGVPQLSETPKITQMYPVLVNQWVLSRVPLPHDPIAKVHAFACRACASARPGHLAPLKAARAARQLAAFVTWPGLQVS